MLLVSPLALFGLGKCVPTPVKPALEYSELAPPKVPPVPQLPTMFPSAPAVSVPHWTGPVTPPPAAPPPAKKEKPRPVKKKPQEPPKCDGDVIGFLKGACK